MLTTAVNDPEYQRRMRELETPVGSVAAMTDISGSLRAALNHHIERNIRSFVVDGRFSIIGG
jgi:hypothetical protein